MGPVALSLFLSLLYLQGSSHSSASAWSISNVFPSLPPPPRALLLNLQANHESWMHDSWEKLDGEAVERDVNTAYKVRRSREGGRGAQGMGIGLRWCTCLVRYTSGDQYNRSMGVAL